MPTVSNECGTSWGHQGRHIGYVIPRRRIWDDVFTFGRLCLRHAAGPPAEGAPHAGVRERLGARERRRAEAAALLDARRLAGGGHALEVVELDALEEEVDVVEDVRLAGARRGGGSKGGVAGRMRRHVHGRTALEGAGRGDPRAGDEGGRTARWVPRVPRAQRGLSAG